MCTPRNTTNFTAKYHKSYYEIPQILLWNTTNLTVDNPVFGNTTNFTVENSVSSEIPQILLSQVYLDGIISGNTRPCWAKNEIPQILLCHLFKVALELPQILLFMNVPKCRGCGVFSLFSKETATWTATFFTVCCRIALLRKTTFLLSVFALLFFRIRYYEWHSI